MRISSISLIVTVAFIVLLPGSTRAESLGTAFTYQGRLIDANEPANGLYDLKFRLYDSISDGSQVGSDVNISETQVDDGYFTVELDFGYVFDGNNRWLEIGIRPGWQNDPAAYTILSPRQAVKPAPYAIATRGIFVDSTENVGIKTGYPKSALHVAGTIWGRGEVPSCTNGDCPQPPPNTGVYGESTTGDGIVGTSVSGFAGHFIGNVNTQGNMYVTGNVGVRTSNPQSALQVAGTIWGRGEVPSCTNGDCPQPPPNTGVYGESSSGDGIVGISDSGYAGHFLGNVNTQGNMYVSGNIGIGTTNPGTKLEVDHGDILIRGVENFTSPGQQAILYLGDTNYSIRSEYAYGLIFETWAAPNAIVVDEWTGNVGISNPSPSYKMDVNGDIQCVTLYEISDDRLKTNVRELTNALDKIQKIRGVSFEWNQAGQTAGAAPGDRQIGVLAQEVESTLPELVSTDKDGYKSVDYTKLTAVLIEAVKELKSENSRLQKRLESLEKGIQGQTLALGKEVRQ